MAPGSCQVSPDGIIIGLRATMMHMNRVQLQLTDSQLEALRHRSAATGRSIAALVREAIEAWIAEDERQRRVDRAVAAIGGFHSGVGDLAENHDAYLDETASS